MSVRPWRLFVALYPPEETRRRMIETLEGLAPAPDPRHRVVAIEHLHMTVQFIGDTPERDLAEVSESVRRSVAGVGPFVLSPRRLITLPDRGPPRLIAVETDAPPALLEAHRRLATRLARSPRSAPGDRFLPHLTLCRFAGTARPDRIDIPVSIAPFRVDSVVLMRSVLKPTAAEHIVVEETPL